MTSDELSDDIPGPPVVSGVVDQIPDGAVKSNLVRMYLIPRAVCKSSNVSLFIVFAFTLAAAASSSSQPFQTAWSDEGISKLSSQHDTSTSLFAAVQSDQHRQSYRRYHGPEKEREGQGACKRPLA